MFEQLLSRIGIGAATVDTVLTEPSVVRGEMLKGEIRLHGGKAPQDINRIELELMTAYQQELTPGAAAYQLSLKHQSLAEDFTLAAGEIKVIPFETLVPIQTPVSQGPTRIWLNTDLDVPWAVDPKDIDSLTVLPEPATEKVLLALKALGYAHTDNSGTYLAMPGDADLSFMQAFEFDATKPHPGRPTQIAMMMQANGYDADCHLDLDPNLEDDDKHRSRMIRFRLRHGAEFGPEQLLRHLGLA